MVDVLNLQEETTEETPDERKMSSSSIFARGDIWNSNRSIWFC